MPLADYAFRVIDKVRLKLGVDNAKGFVADFSLRGSDANGAVKALPGKLARQFSEKTGRGADKWLHYLPIYEAHFDRFRETDLRMLEIGVFNGGSLELWRGYFGAKATIFGIDIDQRCAELFDPPNQVRIGSQADCKFLRSVVHEMGGVDLVIDDGSHIAEHQRQSFDCLFPLLNDGGLYVIEDLHTSYWPGAYQGGYRRRGTAIEFVKLL
ncbi:MAG TPA: class I SAM-dependent methyltransferase, partial [Hymenobacter sp.]